MGRGKELELSCLAVVRARAREREGGMGREIVRVCVREAGDPLELPM